MIDADAVDTAERAAATMREVGRQTTSRALAGEVERGVLTPSRFARSRQPINLCAFIWMAKSFVTRPITETIDERLKPTGTDCLHIING